MALESRGNRTYYYRKRREGGRVVSEYVGSGEFARAAYQIESADREMTRLKIAAEKEDYAEEMPLWAEFEAYFRKIDALFKRELIAMGFHQHKRGEWRKKRNG